MQQIARESFRQGIDIYVLSAGYKPLDASDIMGVPDERIFTCLFTPAGDRPKEGAVKTPISGMSVVMPYHVIAYRDRTEEELLEFLASGPHTLKAIVKHGIIYGGRTVEGGPWNLNNAEKIMMVKHLERLETRGRVRQEDGVYHLV